MNNKLTSIPSLDNIEYDSGSFTANNLELKNAFIYSKNADGSIDYTNLNSYATKKHTDILNIPNGVKTLEYKSLRYVNANTINLPNSIKTIKGNTFHQSKATIYNIPSSIKNIENFAFKHYN